MDKLELFSKKYIKNRSILREVIPLEKPFCLSIEPSNICNFKCIMCPQGNKDYNTISKPIKNMDLECFDKLIKDLETWKVSRFKVIKLYAIGESLLNPDLPYMVKKLKQGGYADTIELTTNGSLLDKDISKALIEYQLDYLRISIYSVDEFNHKRITKSNIKPDEIKDRVIELMEMKKKMNSYKPFVQVKLIDSYSMENELFIQYYDSIADEIYIDKPMNSNNSGDVIEKLYGEKSIEVKKDIMSNNFYYEKKACRYPFDHMTVKSNGDVVVCCADWIRATKIGNIMEESLEEIWNGEKLYEFRKMQLENRRFENKSCKDCDLPLRDLPEDDIDGLSINRIKFRKSKGD